MKQRFSKRTRLVSALLTLAMVFTFLPFSAFAATVQEIEVLDFTTHGCDALQITEGGSVGKWITAFREKMENENEGEKPINATSGYGFYVKTNYNDWYVVDRLDRLYALPETESFQSGEKYYLSVPIHAAEGYIFNTSRDFRFKKITVDGEDLSDVLKKPYQYAESQRTRVYIPLSFTARHKPKIIYGKDATCITSGVKEHYKCQKCGKLFMDYACTEETTEAKVYIKPTRLHNPGDWNKAWSRHYKLCKVCGKDVNTGAHDFVGGKCTICGLERHDLDSAEVEVTEPAAGMTPAMIAAKNVTPDKKTAFSTACTWYEADSGAELSDTAVFAEGKQYRAELKLTARADWQFLDSTTYKINGTAAEKDSSSDAAPWEQVTLSRIFTAKPATEGKVITNIQMTIPAPVAGNSPSSCTVQKSDSRYTIKSLSWTEVDAAGNSISHDVTTFEEGKHYQVRIRLSSNVGYEFEGDKQEAIINGKPYLSYTSSGMDPKDSILYYVTFTAVAGGGSTGGGGGGTVTPPEPPVTPPSGGGDGGKHRMKALCLFERLLFVAERGVQMRINAGDGNGVHVGIDGQDLVGLAREKAVAPHAGVDLEVRLRLLAALGGNAVEHGGVILTGDGEHGAEVEQAVYLVRGGGIRIHASATPASRRARTSAISVTAKRVMPASRQTAAIGMRPSP